MLSARVWLPIANFTSVSLATLSYPMTGCLAEPMFGLGSWIVTTGTPLRVESISSRVPTLAPSGIFGKTMGFWFDFSAVMISSRLFGERTPWGTRIGLYWFTRLSNSWAVISPSCNCLAASWSASAPVRIGLPSENRNSSLAAYWTFLANTTSPTWITSSAPITGWVLFLS